MSSAGINKVGRGAAAGFIATIPMTVAMVWLWKRLPRQEQYALMIASHLIWGAALASLVRHGNENARP